MPGPRKMTLAIVTVLIMASIMTFVHFTNQEDYRILFSNLTREDASNIVTKLKEKKIPYQISPSGETISVPSGQVSELRLELAAAGLPHGGGVGFEIFDNKIFGATEFEQQLNYRRALQGELSRTINSLDEIQQCRVHIVIPKGIPVHRTAEETHGLGDNKAQNRQKIEGIPDRRNRASGGQQCRRFECRRGNDRRQPGKHPVEKTRGFQTCPIVFISNRISAKHREGDGKPDPDPSGKCGWPGKSRSQGKRGIWISE